MLRLDRHNYLWIALLAAGCGASPSRSPAPSSEVEVVRPAARTAPDREPAPQTSRAATTTIESDGVADIRLGQAIPERHLGDQQSALARYDIRWVADAQPFEAWRIEELGVTAMFQGPFTRWAEDVGELDEKRFVDEALAELRAGAKVSAILIESKGPRTHRGIGVGSSWRELLAAYPDAKVIKDPEWFEPRPTCRTHSADQPGVIFHLASCDGEPGDVVRVMIFAP